MPKDEVCAHCGQKAVYPRLGPNREERSETLVCWECGRDVASCRCKGNVKLQKFGIKVEATEEEEPAPRETEVEESRSTVVPLATQAGRRRTSPLPRPRAKKDGLQKPRLETFS